MKPLYGAAIPSAKKEEAFEWLRNNNHADIIKNVVSCSFGRGEDKKAAELLSDMSKKGLVPEQKEGVHSATLRGWVRERVENGDSFPIWIYLVLL